MASDVIEKGAAEAELQRIVDFFEVDPEGDDWEHSRARLLQAIQKGRIVLDDADSTVVLSLVSPLELDNGESIATLSFNEPRAADLKVLDKYKDQEKMARAIHLASRITGQSIGVIDRMGSRDLSTMAAIISLFS